MNFVTSLRSFFSLHPLVIIALFTGIFRSFSLIFHYPPEFT